MSRIFYAVPAGTELLHLLPLDSPRLGGEGAVEPGTLSFFCPRGFESRRLGNKGPSGGGWLEGLAHHTTLRFALAVVRDSCRIEGSWEVRDWCLLLLSLIHI